MGLAFVVLKNWSERKGDENHVEAIVGRANAALSQKQEALIYAFNLPAIVELGTANGFDFELVDQGNLGHDALMAARNQLLGLAAQHPEILQGVRPNGQDDTSQYRIYIDQQKAQAQGVAIADINATLSSIFGGTYVTTLSTVVVLRKFTYKVMQKAVCYLRILVHCMFEMPKGTWCHSLPSWMNLKILGNMVHRV